MDDRLDRLLSGAIVSVARSGREPTLWRVFLALCAADREVSESAVLADVTAAMQRAVRAGTVRVRFDARLRQDVLALVEGLQPCPTLSRRS